MARWSEGGWKTSWWKGWKESIHYRGIEEAPENGKESLHSAHANGMNEWMNLKQIKTSFHRPCSYLWLAYMIGTVRNVSAWRCLNKRIVSNLMTPSQLLCINFYFLQQRAHKHKLRAAIFFPPWVPSKKEIMKITFPQKTLNVTTKYLLVLCGSSQYKTVLSICFTLKLC